jgi:hypothetical protein
MTFTDYRMPDASVLCYLAVIAAVVIVVLALYLFDVFRSYLARRRQSLSDFQKPIILILAFAAMLAAIYFFVDFGA